jgi:hypothetical protein
MKRVLIIYPDPFLSYSPTTLNLYKELSLSFDAQVLTFEPDSNFSSNKIQNDHFKYLPTPKNDFQILFRKALNMGLNRLLKKSSQNYLFTPKAKALIAEIRQFEGEIVAVDFFALWCVQKANRSAHFLSLEIPDEDSYKENCISDGLVKSVIIQTDERFRYLFGDKKIPKFLVQNSPPYIHSRVDISTREQTKLLFCGSALPAFGLFSCIEFLRDYSEYSLTLKGAIPISTRKILEKYFGDLIRESRLILDDEYLSAENLNNYVSQFRIGFVFYDFYRFDFINRFNYHTAPSGKLFQYYNAGIPVIGSNISGLSSVKELGAGILIDSMSSLSIKKSIDSIEENYLNFAKSSKEASKSYDFKANIQEFIRFLKN